MTAPSQTQQLSSQSSWPLHSVALTQAIEHRAQAELPTHTLMARAGLATAQLAMAIAPHGQTIWIACGPGNNGGDGLEAAVHLQTWGKHPVVTWLGQDGQVPQEAQQAWLRAKAAGVAFQNQAPAQFDLAIDALLGIGAQRPPESLMAQWLQAMNTSDSPVLCVDVPTGLLADTGEWLTPTRPSARNRHTLSLLTLKPGLFTADGRDAAGRVWFNDLGVHPTKPPKAWLQLSLPAQAEKAHTSHKGSFGDVIVIGGAPGMAGAGVLASLSALHGGAGRVFAALLDAEAKHALAATHPALMVRDPVGLALDNATVVCGCGGSDAIHALMPHVLSSSHKLVLDADGLNAIARDTSLQILLKKRSARGKPTVLTPHPLEAARLLDCTAKEIQHNRLQAAQQLAETFQTVVILKGSGSVVASPKHTRVINASGNALLATAGTGDVLAGLLGAYLARSTDAFAASCQAIYTHGHIADTWPIDAPTLDAAQLAASVR
jgi:ADP-dependent NAD(P)H-hydrate dehydratase / NAD(P)H-hydrate epimerase